MRQSESSSAKDSVFSFRTWIAKGLRKGRQFSPDFRKKCRRLALEIIRAKCGNIISNSFEWKNLFEPMQYCIKVHLVSRRFNLCRISPLRYHGNQLQATLSTVACNKQFFSKKKNYNSFVFQILHLLKQFFIFEIVNFDFRFSV